MNLAPIVLFVYNRPDHTLQTLNALAANELSKDSMLYIFSDGAKQNADENELHKIKKVRAVIRQKQWCGQVNIEEKNENKGLADSIIDGVTKVINKHGNIIVLEDDLITSRYFLHFMNKALQIYNSEKKVISIGGCNVYDIREEEHCFFLNTPDCLGWATWKDRWSYFEKSSVALMHKLETDKNAKFIFNAYNSFDYTGMLQKHIESNVDSWAIRWQAVAALQKGIVLYPSPSLTQHLASENGTATHYANAITPELLEEKVDLKKIDLHVTKSSVKRVKEFHDKLNKELKKLSFQQNALSSSISFFRIKYGKVSRKLKQIISQSTPPALIRVFRKKNATGSLNNSNQWTGNYKSWDAAAASSSGYDNNIILEKCSNALLKVKKGEAVYERDSVLFDKIQYTWALLACLENIAIAGNKKICIIDFGGSLGSTYFQNRFFLKDVDVRWVIIEQQQFVDCGKKYFEDDILSFEYSLEDAINKYKVDCVLLSSVLQYLPKPFDLIKKILSYNTKNILIDRTGFISGNDSIITIQNVPETIYKASYPCWFFNEEKFVKQISGQLKLVTDFDDVFTTPFTSDNRLHYWKGFYFRNDN